MQVVLRRLTGGRRTENSQEDIGAIALDSHFESTLVFQYQTEGVADLERQGV
jgi:hypothetical protein